MAELGGDLDLAEKPVGAERVGQLGLEDLDRDEPVVLQVAGAIHDCHAVLTQLSFYCIAAVQGSGESFALVDGHDLIWASIEGPHHPSHLLHIPPTKVHLSDGCLPYQLCHVIWVDPAAGEDLDPPPRLDDEPADLRGALRRGRRTTRRQHAIHAEVN